MNKQTFTSAEIISFISYPTFDPNIICANDSTYPRISVVVPSYNQGQFLERTLLSILNQNYPNTEIIVMDGGSKDESVEIIKKYEPHLSYWCSKPDKGQSNAINEGFARASGDLLAWQNSDDLYLPGFFNLVANSFRAYPKAQLFTGNVYLLDKDDKILEHPYFPPFSLDFLIYVGWNISSQAIFLKRQTTLEAGPLREDIHFGFDWDWFIRVGKIVQHAVMYKAFGGCYRIHPESKFSTQSLQQRRLLDHQILRNNGISVKDETRIEQQYWQRVVLLRLQCWLSILLLYGPQGNILKSPFVWGMAKFFIGRLQPFFIRALEKCGVICEGF